MQSVKRGLIALITLVLAVGFLTACEDDTNKDSADNRERASRTGTVTKLVDRQPVETMDYSPTRETINLWAKTWGKDPNKLAYVYMRAAAGQIVGYYIFRGPPVSSCAGITAPYDFKEVDLG